MNIQNALQLATQLPQSSSARLDVALLLSHCLDQNRTYLRTWPERELNPTQEMHFLALLDRCKQGEPLAHVLGHKEFWSLQLEINKSTLIPRPDTELLVQLALELMPAKAPRLLDLGTGSGAIALALSQERPDANVMAVDFSTEACQLAQRNAQRLGLQRVHVVHSHWFEAIDTRFDVILSNPPYIAASDPHLEQLRYEPHSALVAADNGLADLRQIASQAPAYLRPLGWLLLEHGWQQGESVRAMLASANFIHIATHRDLGGNERVTLGQAPSHPHGAQQ